MAGVDNIIYEKTYAFAVRIVNAYKFLTTAQKEFVLSKQLLRSGTAIGALTREAKFAQSRADFISKLSIALKEANETLYWIELLHDTEYLAEPAFDSLHKDATELTAILVSIVKSTKSSNI